MPDQMQPPEGGQAGQPGQGGGKLSDLVIDINSKLLALVSVLEKSQALPPEKLGQLSEIVDNFQSFVSEDMGGSQGQPQAAAPPVKGNVPMEAGAKNVQPVY